MDQTKDAEDPADAPYHFTPLHPIHLASSLNPIPLCRSRFSFQSFMESDSLSLLRLISVPRVRPRHRYQRSFTVAFGALLHRVGTIGVGRKNVGMGRYWHA